MSTTATISIRPFQSERSRLTESERRALDDLARDMAGRYLRSFGPKMRDQIPRLVERETAIGLLPLWPVDDPVAHVEILNRVRRGAAAHLANASGGASPSRPAS